jgi:hypothetical protein
MPSLQLITNTELQELRRLHSEADLASSWTTADNLDPRHLSTTAYLDPSFLDPNQDLDSSRILILIKLVDL